MKTPSINLDKDYDDTYFETHESDNYDTNLNKNVSKIYDFVDSYQYTFSLCLIGNADVGKTSLLNRFCDNNFKEKYLNTIGVDFKIISLNYKGNNIKLHLWDTAGQERFKSIAVNYYRNVLGFYYVFDVSNRESFQALDKWISLANTHNKTSIVNMLVANKIDLERKVSREEALQFAQKNNLIYYETSAKNSENVDNSFYIMTVKLFEYYSKNQKLYEMSTVCGQKRNERKLLEVSEKINNEPAHNKFCSC